MSNFHPLSLSQQVAKHLQGEILRGRWTEVMPGKPYLATELGVNHQTVDGALQQLEREGWLVAQGAGRSRRIAQLGEAGSGRPVRVALLVWSPADRSWTYVVDLQHRLAEAGHVSFHTPKTLLELNMDVGRIAKMVAQTKADAWVVVCASAEVLAWFARQKTPTFALFGGGWRGLPIAAAGPDCQAAIKEGTESLLKLGHRRIAMLIRRQHRQPIMGQLPKSFLTALAAYGIPASPYVLPDWVETPAGFQQCLTSLFQVTPPTGLLVDEPELFAATQHFLATRGLRVPQDFSLIFLGHEQVFEWCVPTVTRLQQDFSQLVPRILRWANHVSQGKRDLRQRGFPTQFIPGGTVAPPPVATRPTPESKLAPPLTRRDELPQVPASTREPRPGRTSLARLRTKNMRTPKPRISRT